MPDEEGHCSQLPQRPATAEQLTRSEEAWQARCLELEWSLQKFRDQAQNIREMLREKVGKED